MSAAARSAGRLRDLASAATRFGRTALVVPVGWAEGVVEPWRRRYDDSAAAGMPAHVTVVYPFLRAREVDRSVDLALEETIRGIASFRFRLAGVGTFPGVVFLRPEPAEPFVELTRAIWERWPECPPYGGAHDEIVPHLTVATRPPSDAIAELEQQLPLEGPADEVWLMEPDRRGRWVRRRSFALG
jgi:2'-5' RNA ligase